MAAPFFEQIKQHFWKRCLVDYLNELPQRTKWKTNAPSLKPGDLVIIREDNIPHYAGPWHGLKPCILGLMACCVRPRLRLSREATRDPPFDYVPFRWTSRKPVASDLFTAKFNLFIQFVYISQLTLISFQFARLFHLFFVLFYFCLLLVEKTLFSKRPVCLGFFTRKLTRCYQAKTCHRATVGDNA